MCGQCVHLVSHRRGTAGSDHNCSYSPHCSLCTFLPHPECVSQSDPLGPMSDICPTLVRSFQWLPAVSHPEQVASPSFSCFSHTCHFPRFRSLAYPVAYDPLPNIHILGPAELTVCILTPQRSTPSPVPQTRESSSTLEKQMGANGHGAGSNAAGSKGLTLAPTGEGTPPVPALFLEVSFCLCLCHLPRGWASSVRCEQCLIMRPPEMPCSEPSSSWLCTEQDCCPP